MLICTNTETNKRTANFLKYEIANGMLNLVKLSQP